MRPRTAAARPSARRLTSTVAAAVVVVASLFAVGPPAHAAGPAADPAARTITLAGSLQSELGCPDDWQPACPATQLAQTGPDTYAHRFTLPAGAYEFKIAVNGSWDENYGAGGAAGGANIPLVLAGTATLDFAYSDTTHRVSITPTDLPSPAVTPADKLIAGPSLRQPLTREQFYFVMTDRFANADTTNDSGGRTGDRLQTGFDPTAKGFYHGGDLKGLISKLDYIKKVGTTSLWLTPSFVNKPVQGPPGSESAGYHGYWITDFTHIDPHLGSNADMKTLIATAHKKGMKVFFDIITNHTADVIDNAQKQYTYISKATAPYKDAAGNTFDDRDFVNSPNFPALNAQSFPYTPVFDKPADATAKTPAWLNDVTLYHNRGDSTYAGESATYGDFAGLDDLFTEQPKVEKGMEDIYKAWVDFGIDGFRIDTAKHVNTEFWQKFSPAMLQQAKQDGNSKFFMFGEVFDADPKFQSIYSTTAKLPATLDFGFQSAAVAVTNGKPTSTLSDLFAGDDYYTDTDSNAYDLPTFLGNHDMGRVGNFVGGSLAKDQFAHALMYTLRGQPVVYYGDEQGFTGDGGDQDARQDMFASKVASYNDDTVIGGTPGSMDRYGTTGAMFRTIAGLSALRKANPALADGAQIPRYSSDSTGIFAVSRVSGGVSGGVSGAASGGASASASRTGQHEYLVVANNADTAKTASFPTYTPGALFAPIYGGGPRLLSRRDGSVTVTVAPMSVRVFKASRSIPRSRRAVPVYPQSPSAGGVVADRAEIRAAVPANTPVQVSFGYRPVGTTDWQKLGTDDNAPYRVFHDVSGVAKGTLLEYRMVVTDNRGHTSATSTYGIVGDAPAKGGSGGVGAVTQPAAVSVPGSDNSEMGCPADWSPDCAQAQLSLDPNDAIWKGSYTLPAGPYAYKAAINKTWDENYGAGAVLNGGNIEFSSDGTTPISFFYDHRTHYVSSTAQGPIAVAAGSFQSEMGCAADWDPACMRSWLQDPDGDGVYTLSTTQIPAGTYDFKVALGLNWDVNYGAGGVANGGNVSFTVDGDNVVTTLSYDSQTHAVSVATAKPGAKPDLSVAKAYWLNRRTIAYPVDRLPAGSDPAWFRFRLHWGQLAVDRTSVGGRSVPVTLVGGAPEGYLALRLDPLTALFAQRIKAGPMVALAVYDDAQQLLDATGVRPSA
ncbi:alpha-amylase family glycosyl hydrolase [Jatrophihabitans telluris]|uniref:Alpha-amylase family glycosyl hydrolase n=1 Tax=Jatrophihabitans telluris TaxID=2038343 RepID=A0ABY4R0W8_9ACTN|nr:alpha-amylase family glycosyl hydrolase [Jatrophihabitans telluris]UQX89538.1 alpha-amylase family glycosyl hydrolase [Jatrophihabitans telluris]